VNRLAALLIFLCFFNAVSAQEAPEQPAPAEPAATEKTTSDTLSSLEARIQALEARVSTAEAEQARVSQENKKLSEQLAHQEAARSVTPEKETTVPLVTFQPYGFIELTGWANDAQIFVNNMPLYVVDKSKSTVGLTARSSRIGVDIGFPRIEAVSLTGKLEIDLGATMSDSGTAESSPMFRLRHAYTALSKTWDTTTIGAKAGQTWAVATPLVWPAFISQSMGWGMGNTWQRMPLFEIFVTQKFAETFSFTAEVAAARAMTGASANRASAVEINIDAGDASHIPQIQSQLSLKGTIPSAELDLFCAVAGAWGRENYKSGVYLNNKKDVKYIGETVDVGYATGALRVSHQYAEIAGKFWWGQNVDVFGYYGGALITEDVDATTKRVTGSQRALGWWTQLTMKPIKGLALHVGYGAEDPDEKQKGASPTYYENDSLWVAVYYTLWDRLVLGFTWTQLQTKDFKKSDGTHVSQTGNSLMGQIRLLF